MEEKRDMTFTSAMTLAQMGITNVPNCYILPSPQRPNFHQEIPNDLPVIDLSLLGNPSLRSRVTDQVRAACKELGIFQVINHGISPTCTQDALYVSEEFFNLSNDTKRCFASTDVHKPVRYGTSLNHIKDKVQYWRDFIKHYANPISTWIDLWPSHPPTYQKKMGNYAKALHALHKRLMEVVLESLGLRPDCLLKDLEQNSQVMAVNYYPACPEPELALGLPPHSDYGLLTIILQDRNGLEIMNQERKWQCVPMIEEALIVQLGDQMEVLSNGRYKSVTHRAFLNSERKRISIASLHSLAIDENVVPVPELVDDEHPLSYKEASFQDFLKFISERDILEGSYIDTLRKKL